MIDSLLTTGAAIGIVVGILLARHAEPVFIGWLVDLIDSLKRLFR